MSAVSSGVQVVNAALEFIAAQTTITVIDDTTPAGKAAGIIYVPTVQLMLRELDPDFARTTAALAIDAGVPPAPWDFQYVYPADCVRVRNVRPPGSGTGALSDPNNPAPIRSNVAFANSVKIILTNQANALAVYTTSAVVETDWDAAFTDTVIRRLANPLAMALSGRPDFATTILQQSAMMAATCENVDESAFRRRM